MILAKKRPVTNAEAGKILEQSKEELSSLQRVVRDYTSRFSKLDVEEATKLVQELVNHIGLDESTAVQLVNCMPNSLEEVRTILGRQRIISEDDLKRILEILEGHARSERGGAH